MASTTDSRESLQGQTDEVSSRSHAPKPEVLITAERGGSRVVWWGRMRFVTESNLVEQIVKTLRSRHNALLA